MSNDTDPSVGTTQVDGQTKRRRKPPLLRVVFDTNQLYTGSASDLLRASVRTGLSRATSCYIDLAAHTHRDLHHTPRANFPSP